MEALDQNFKIRSYKAKVSSLPKMRTKDKARVEFFTDFSIYVIDFNQNHLGAVYWQNLSSRYPKKAVNTTVVKFIWSFLLYWIDKFGQ